MRILMRKRKKVSDQLKFSLSEARKKASQEIGRQRDFTSTIALLN